MLAASLAAVAFLFAPASAQPGWQRAGDAAYIIVGALLAIAMLTGLRRLSPEERRGWRELVVGVWVVVCANVAWSILSLAGIDPTYPGPVDVVYLTGYLIVVAGVFLLPSYRSLAPERLKWMMDALIVTVAVGLVAWDWFLGQAVRAALSASTSAYGRTVAAAFPLTVLLNLAAVVVLLLRPARHRPDVRLVAIAAALVATTVGDAVYLASVTDGAYWSGNRLNFFWFLWHALLAAVAGAFDAPGPLREREPGPRRWAYVGLYGAAAVFVGLVLAKPTGDPEHTTLHVAAAGVLCLVVLRQSIAIRATKRIVEKHRNDLVASISHELRTPLAAIHGFSGLLTRPDLDPAEQREFAGLIHDQTSYLTRVVGDLVAVARNTLDREELELRPSPVAALVETAGRLANVQPETRVPADLVVVCDPMRIGQVLVNLLVNAARYGHGRVAVVAHGHPDRVEVEVHDDGDGVPRAYQDLIWERFERGVFRLDARRPGSGLGLPIARALALAHGGTIEYRPSRSYGGACFALILPSRPPEPRGRPELAPAVAG